jgi:hypothetical protein
VPLAAPRIGADTRARRSALYPRVQLF